MSEETWEAIKADIKRGQEDIWSLETALSEPQVLFLGTQSRMPSKYRNTSAIYFFSGRGAILMDCSEGTYSQLFDYCETKQQCKSLLMKT